MPDEETGSRGVSFRIRVAVGEHDVNQRVDCLFVIYSIIIYFIMIAGLLRLARKRADLTQRELAERSGIAQPAIARIESGGASPRAATVEKLLAACGFRLKIEPRRGEGVDRTAIRELLELTPDARARLAAEEANRLSAALSHSRRRKRQ
jgi:transcriptional regulator with XRE-family HTH domain